MNIVLTGAGKGIGFELCKIFLAHGHSVIGISRDVSQLVEIESPNLTVFSFDLTRFNDGDHLLKQIKFHFDHVDVLINNAGYLIRKSFVDSNMHDWHEMLNYNLLIHVFVTKSLLKLLGGDKYSSIINIGSMAGFSGSKKYPGLSAYSSAKGALSSFTECIAEELSHNNISCNCLCLGSADTEMFAEAFPGLTASLSASEMARIVFKQIEKIHFKENGSVIPLSIQNP